jgi:hypothetical protein
LTNAIGLQTDELSAASSRQRLPPALGSNSPQVELTRAHGEDRRGEGPHAGRSGSRDSALVVEHSSLCGQIALAKSSGHHGYAWHRPRPGASLKQATGGWTRRSSAARIAAVFSVLARPVDTLTMRI